MSRASRGRRLAVALAASTLLVAGCGGPPPSPKARPEARVLLIGIDGAAWDEILPLMRDGRMPHLEALMRQGFSARLTTMAPALSPVIWTTIATGKAPDKHGIHGFVVLDRDGRELPVTSNLRRTSAVWTQLGDAGVKVGVVGWWVTWPAEPVNGWMVSPLVAPGQTTWKGSVYAEGGEEQTWPRDLVHSLSGDIKTGVGRAEAEFEQLLTVPAGMALPEYLSAFLRDTRWVHVSDTLFRDLGERLLRERQPAFMTVYFGGVDVVGHRFWRFAHPGSGRWESTGEQRRVFGPALQRFYVWADDAIGHLVRAAPAGTTCLVVSDHGMEAAERDPNRPRTAWNLFPQEISGGHTRGPDGILVFAGPGATRNFRAEYLEQREELPRLGSRAHPAVLDITPSLLHFFGLPVGRDMDGEVLGLLFEPVLRERPVVSRATWDDPSRLPDPTPRESPRMEEIKRRLEGLGYIGN